MSLLGRFVQAAAVLTVGALVVTGAGVAHASGGSYGSVAVGTFQVGHGVGPTQAVADRAALAACGVVYCRVTLQLKDDCGAVVEFGTHTPLGYAPSYYYGTGATAIEAQQMARSQVPPITPWLTAINLAWGSSTLSPAFVRDTVCTTNAAAGTTRSAGDLYGAIAVGADRAGSSVDYPTQPAADRAALATCDRVSLVGCFIETRIHNDCGVVLKLNGIPFSGNGPTRAAAERKAKSNAGVGLGVTGRPVILDTVCASNAR